VQEAIVGRPDLVTVAFADGSGVAVVAGGQLLRWIDGCGARIATPVLGWDADPADLECLVRLVLAGRLPTPGADLDRLAPLTPREVEILGLLGAGWSREGISEALGISLHTVRTHLGRVTAKLGVHSTFEAVAVARCAGLRALREELRC
jgi:DNA-binding CsgD family transcriptional regulator